MFGRLEKFVTPNQASIIIVFALTEIARAHPYIETHPQDVHQYPYWSGNDNCLVESVALSDIFLISSRKRRERKSENSEGVERRLVLRRRLIIPKKNTR